MGWELIIAMAVAAAVTRGWEHSARRSAAAWTEAKNGARQRRETREEERQQRAQARSDWYDNQIERGWRSPLWWANRGGWTAVAATRGAKAAAKGAREGASVGAREGAHLGRTAAWDGWTLAQTWRQWRTQRAAERKQAERADRDDDDVEQPDESDTPNNDPAEPPPVMVPCLGCGTMITAVRAEVAAGMCADCSETREATPATDTDDGSAADADSDDVHDAEIVEPQAINPPSKQTTEPKAADTEPTYGNQNPTSATKENRMPSEDQEEIFESYKATISRMVFASGLGNHNVAESLEKEAIDLWGQMDPESQNVAKRFNREVKTVIDEENKNRGNGVGGQGGQNRSETTSAPPANDSRGDTQTPGTAVVPTGEAVSLPTAIQQVSGLAAACRQGAANIELAVAHLQQVDVNDESITELQTAKDHLTAAATKYEEALTALRTQMPVRDNRMAHPGAGKKHFLLSG